MSTRLGTHQAMHRVVDMAITETIYSSAFYDIFMRRNIVLVSIGAWLIVAGAEGQLADDFNPPRANCCLLNSPRGLADQLQDWNQLGRYHQANEELKKVSAEPKRVVFMGDSITDFWRLDQYFPGKPYVNRGIGGQTTPQMLVRMYPDVI